MLENVKKMGIENLIIVALSAVEWFMICVVMFT